MRATSESGQSGLQGTDTERRPLVSVVVPFFNGEDLLTECLTHLLRQTYEPMEVIAVDDGSDEKLFDGVRTRFPTVRFLRLPSNRGFCGASNAGIGEASGDFIALLNSDAVAHPEWLESLVESMESSSSIGACASKVLTMDSPALIESAGDCYRPWRTPRARAAGLPADEMSVPGPVFGASAAAALYRRAALAEVGSFDEDLESYYEDIELSFRLRLAGYIVWYVPSAVVHHRGHASYGRREVLHRVLRNDILIYVKDTPAVLFWLFLPALLARQVYQFVYYSLRGAPGLVVGAKIDAIRRVPRFLRKRAKVRGLHKVSLAAMMRAFLT
jgi:GT2 family glycosyltransferase